VRIFGGPPQVIPSPNSDEHQHDLSLDDIIPYQTAGPSGLFEREYIGVDADHHHQESLDEILFQMVEHAKILSLSMQQNPEMEQGQDASLAIVASGGDFIGESLSSDMEFTSVSILGSDLSAGQSGQGGLSDGSSARTSSDMDMTSVLGLVSRAVRFRLAWGRAVWLISGFFDSNQDVIRPSNVPGDYPKEEEGDSIVVDARALVGM